MYQKFGKRLLDILLAGFALICLSPLFVIVILAILLEDGRPILFRQKRVGQYGHHFTILKFRSMPTNTKDIPSSQANAIQITRTGTVIRRTNIDELPQLLNILSGKMSIVGPRPALASQEELCALRRQLGAFSCKPGLTGLAQIKAYSGMPDKEKASWDAQYCQVVTFLNDIQIILSTFRYLLKPPPVY